MESDSATNPARSLRERIEEWSSENAADFPPEIRKLFEEKTEEILKSNILSKAIGEGHGSPDFTVAAADGHPVRLGEQVTRGPVILSFYRGTWCPYCNLEFEALLEALPGFREKSASVLALSPQVTDRRTVPVTTGFLDLCDRENQVARKFGLVYPLGEQIKNVYHQFGIRLEELNADPSYEVPIPATYLIDQNMEVRYAKADPDITQRAEPEDLLERLRSLS